MKKIKRTIAIVLSLLVIMSALGLNLVYAATYSGTISVGETKDITINAGQGTRLDFSTAKGGVYQLEVSDENATCELYGPKNNKIDLTEVKKVDGGMVFAYGDTDKAFVANTSYYFIVDTTESVECTATLNVYHKYIKTDIGSDATCTKEGSVVYVCTICGEESSEVIEKKGHDLNLFDKCSRCGYYVIDNFVYDINSGKAEVVGYEGKEKTDFVIPSSVRHDLILTADVTSIGDKAFENSLTDRCELTIPEGVKKIGAGAFANNNIQTVYIPHSVTSIGSDAFKNSNVKDLYFSGTKSEWQKLGDSAKFGITTGTSVHLEKEASAPASVVLSKIENKVDGIKITWNVADGAEQYVVFRKTNPDAKWATLATVDGALSTSYIDLTVVNGTKYYYTVRGINPVGKGGYEKDGLNLIRLAEPVVTVANSVKGVTIKWGSVKNANGYILYRKAPEDTSWVRVEKLVGNTNTSYSDVNVQTGTTYKYTVKAYNGQNLSSYCSGVSTYYLKSPTVTTENASNGVRVNWDKITGAQGYYVYRKTGDNGTYSQIAQIKTVATTSYVDRTAENDNGKTYVYTVRAYNDTTRSSYAGHKIVRLTSVSISSLKSPSSKKITVNWNKNSNASGYEIQYSTSSSFALNVKTTTVNSGSTLTKSISGLTGGRTYYVRVRAYKSVSGKIYYSDWSSRKSVSVKR